MTSHVAHVKLILETARTKKYMRPRILHLITNAVNLAKDHGFISILEVVSSHN